jgi:hypothetical protein
VAIGTIQKSFRNYLSNIRGKHEIKELQKTTTMGTAHKQQKLIMYKMLITATVITCGINCNSRIAGTVYNIQTYFALGILL